jgi:N-acetylmuramoyl-L-alanine amidase
LTGSDIAPGFEPEIERSPLKRALRHLIVIGVVSAVSATVFTAWKPTGLDPGEWAAQLVSQSESISPGLDESGVIDSGSLDELEIGIVAGHMGVHPDTGYEDSGATCPDGLTEAEVNANIARLVVQGLEAAGYKATLLEEFDERLAGYRAIALVSIHADSCLWINEDASGFKVTSALDTAIPDRSQRLVACLVDRYSQNTGMRFHTGSITRDMTEYHSFYEIHSQTPAAIIETGFLHLDRDFLTQQPNTAARGIVDGILCYVNNEPASIGPEGAP